MAASDFLARPKTPIDLNLPRGASTVDVSIIDTTSVIKLPMAVMTQPEVGGYTTCELPCFSFLITHPSSGRRLLFDLGLRKDFENSPLPLLQRVKRIGATAQADKNVADILVEHKIPAGEIEAIIWSHCHWDHTGDPSTFPPETALVVGPGFKQRWGKAYPSDPESVLSETAWQDRELREISFENSDLKIGRFKAFDYFGDGSFYLLDTPGHLLAHLCGIARTTEDTFIFMGGDATHHGGEMRPSEYLPLPANLLLGDPRLASIPCPCPGDMILEHIHPEQSATRPFLRASDNGNEDPPTADWTTEGVMEFDANDRVFVVIAHDSSLLNVCDFFPKPANDWRERNWGKNGRWRFVRDFLQSPIAKNVPWDA